MRPLTWIVLALHLTVMAYILVESWADNATTRHIHNFNRTTK